MPRIGPVESLPKIRFFSRDTAGTEIKSGHVFNGSLLTVGTVIYAQGESPSDAEKDITLQLALTPCSNPVNPPATATMTAVEVTLDICKSRTSPTKEPEPLPQADVSRHGHL